MGLIDTHAHINMPKFDEDIDEVIGRAKEHGVEKILLPNVDSDSIESMMNLALKYQGYCLPMMGIHPTSVDENYQKELDCVESWLNKEQFVAIGEVGIDLYWDKTYLKEQVIVFEKHLEWAKQFNLPVVIHARESFNEIFEVLDRKGTTGLKGVFHSFTGDDVEAEKILQYDNFYISINGIATFKKSHLPQVIEKIDLAKIVLETDAPYLSPVPKRGKRNEPAYVMHIAQKVAEIKKISLEEVIDVTTSNAKMLFSL